MAATLAVVTGDLIGKVANDHRYQCLIEEPFSAIEWFVIGNVLVSLPTGFGKSLILWTVSVLDHLRGYTRAKSISSICNVIGLS